MSEALKKIKTYISVGSEEKDEEEEDDLGLSNLREEICSWCPTLTYKQRLYGFGICFCIGWFLSFLSVVTLSQIRSHPGKFATLYSFGSITGLCSTMFLWGPMAQLKRMFSLVRISATCIYLFAIGLTLYLAFTKQQPIAVLGAILLQFLAMVWYCLSYIPYGRRLAKKCIEKVCSF